MKTMIPRRITFALCSLTVAGSFTLPAQQAPPPSRFNVKLGAISAPNATDLPAVNWGYLPSFSFTADGKELILARVVDTNSNLYVAKRAKPGDPWGPIQPVGAPINSVSAEAGPSVSADGLILVWCDGWVFGANPRPGGRGQSDLWMSTRPNRASPWGEPVNLGPAVNTEVHEYLPPLTGDGLELYFSRQINTNTVAELYVTKRPTRIAPWSAAVRLPDYINTPGANGGAGKTLSADALTLLYGSYPENPPHEENIWVSTRQTRSSPWGAPVSIGAAVNSPWNQVAPIALASHGSALYFLHNGSADSLIINTWELKRVELLPVLEITVGYSSLFGRAGLEGSTNLNGAWAPVAPPAFTENAVTQVVLPATEAQGFFRLRSPQPQARRQTL